MRLWHKDLIPVLPRKQLLGQWREVCLIAKAIAEKGTPNHILVNRVMDYHLSHFEGYARIVYDEMKKRGYKAEWSRFESQFPFAPYGFFSDWKEVPYDELFSEWHNRRYLLQCLANLQEKFDCGGVGKDEWERIAEWFHVDDLLNDDMAALIA